MNIHELTDQIAAILPEFSRTGGKTAIKIRNELRSGVAPDLSLDDVKRAILQMQVQSRINSYRATRKKFWRYTQPCPV